MSFYTKFFTKVYTTVSMKDALEAKERGEFGADFLLACTQIPVYSVPTSAFSQPGTTQSASSNKPVAVAEASPSVTITVTPALIKKPERKIPTLEEFKALPENQKCHWECLHCCEPALGEAYMPGSYCSQMCAYYGYL